MNTPLEQALAQLVTDGTLRADQADAVRRTVALSTPATRAEDRAADRPAWSGVVAEVGGYVGAAFVLAGVVVLTGPRWNSFGTAERLAVLGVPALVLLAAAAAVLVSAPGGWPVRHRRGTGLRRRLAAALLLVTAGLLGGVAAVLAGDTSTWQGVAWTGTATAALAAGYLAVRTPLLNVATAATAATLAPLLVARAVGDWQWEGLWTGLAVVGVAVVWLVLALTGLLDEPALGAAVAAALAFVGGEIVAVGSRWNDLGYLVLTAVAVGGLLGYVRTRQVGVLAIGVVALATVVPQAVIDWTDGALGAAGGLLVTGLSILGASVLGLRLRSTTTAAPAV